MTLIFFYVCSEYDKQIAQHILWIVIVATEPLVRFTGVLMLDSYSAFASAQILSAFVWHSYLKEHGYKDSYQKPIAPEHMAKTASAL